MGLIRGYAINQYVDVLLKVGKLNFVIFG